jgi:MFS family permease
VGIAILLLLYVYEKRIKTPLLDFSLFGNKTFTAFNLVSGLAMVVFMGMAFVLTFYLQDILHWTSMQAGLAFLPVPAVTAITAAFGSRIKSWKTGALVVSVTILAGLLLLAQTDPGVAYYKLILPAMILIAAGSGVLMSVGFAAIISSAPTEKSGGASGTLNTVQQLGGLIGVALVAGIVFRYNVAFYLLSVAALVGVATSFFVSNKDRVAGVN